MVPLLNVIGVIALVVGIIIWISMLQSALTKEPDEEQRPSESRSDKPTE
jgi:hypothetical protein